MLASRNLSLSNRQILQLIRRVPPLLQVDILDIVPAQVVLSVREGMEFLLDEVEDVEPTSSSPDR